MRFFRAFLGTLTLLAAAFALAAAVVNPRRELFGTRFPALQPNSRAVKLVMLDSFAAHHPVRALILGSSRSMKLSPAQLGKLTGQPFFNLGVFSGRPEDFLALYRAATRRHPDINLLLVGVDADGLNPRQPSEGEFENNAELQQALRGAPFSVVDWGKFLAHRAVDLYSMGYARDVLASLNATRHPPTPMYSFDADGSIEFPKYDREIAAGTFSLDRVLATCIDNGVNQLALIRETDVARLRYLRTLIADARAHGVDVVVWSPPLHPRFRAAISQNLLARGNLTRISSDIRRLTREAAVPFVDLESSGDFLPDATAWYDCVHYRSSEAARIAALLATELRADGHGL